MVAPMEVFKAISHRASVRAFRSDLPREGDIERILRAATLAPSAGNIQPWVFVVTKRVETKKALAGAALDQRFIAQAPIVITVCAVGESSAARYGERGRELYCLQDTAAAIQNILLSATALGYGTCWIGAFDEDAVRKVLGVPAKVRPVALIPLGFPDEDLPRVKRKPLEAVVRFEAYGGENLQGK
jgi:nitroreductase